jgi:hypothetical protein
LYGCETWTHTLKEEDNLRIAENRVLRRIFVPTGYEAAREWRTLHS